MVYRATATIEARKANLKEHILNTALSLVAKGGFRHASIKSVAQEAGIATGTIYRYFFSKTDLFVEVFRVASLKEFNIAQHASNEIDGSVTAQIERNIITFASRALRGPHMAYALIAEPVDPLVEAERLIFRRNYAEYLETLLIEGINNGEFCQQNTTVSASALTGLMGEVLVRQVTPMLKKISQKKTVQEIANFALRAITGKEVNYVNC